MDIKALAKSKRGHTQHHNKKTHHSHKPKAPSPSSSSLGSNNSAKNPLVNEEKKSRGSRSQRSSALPSNWERYEEDEEEFDSASESARKTLDVVLPKSKGADFRHLVAEAQSHAETSLEGFPSLDDLLPGEFGVGLRSMLVVRGEDIVSWTGDDNFVVEDKTGENQEASFMSLNLHALAESLAKVDISKRLFVESDLIPTELSVEDFAGGRNEEHDKLEITEDSELATRMPKELNLDDFTVDQVTSSSSCSSSHAASTFTLSNDFTVPMNSVNVEFQQVSGSGKNKATILSSGASLHSTGDTRGKHTAFEAAAAEKELDMLLDSLSESKVVDPRVSSVDPLQVSKKEPVPPKTASVTTSLDDALDDLLEETSTLMKPNVLLRPPEEKPVLHSMQSSPSGSKSKVSDDFDSWFDTL
ncbi:uncharacterized protein LOC113858433 [Abrus precatorius]|uniref:Uncharacterized protein LOC113858433 n=1 Tax=Abrus precatorius TaxID=3816 RepID=A0A8B8KSM8_ABRPR|nr:uncharacterized protein LOC113858433 [Abrus precatorius]